MEAKQAANNQQPTGNGQQEMANAQQVLAQINCTYRLVWVNEMFNNCSASSWSQLTLHYVQLFKIDFDWIWYHD